jgi:glycosyltransferase involved in cell wall biosynthesis
MTGLETVTAGVDHAFPRQRERGSTALADLHVVLVGINYWPEPTGIAPYTTGMAEHLATIAASVTVLTGLPSYPSWEVPAEYRRGLRFAESRNGVSIRRLKHFVPSKQDALRRGVYELSFRTHARAVRLCAKPDVVIGITPALGGASAAARLADRHDARLVLVVQDLLGQAARQSGIAGGQRIATVVGALEARALRRADAVAVVSDAFRSQLVTYGLAEERVHTVPNWVHVKPAAAERALTRSRFGWRPDVTVALHAGNMGLKQDLGNIIRAAELTRHRTDVVWALMGDGSQRRTLMEQAAGLPNLQFLPLCSEETYRDVLAAADILLLNERAGVYEMSLPSKLTSYFVTGRPVAGAVHPMGASARELERAGAPAPVAPGDPAALVRLVTTLSADRDVRDRHGAAARAYAAEVLSADAAMRRLEALIVGEACASRRARDRRTS